MGLLTGRQTQNKHTHKKHIEMNAKQLETDIKHTNTHITRINNADTQPNGQTIKQLN